MKIEEDIILLKDFTEGNFKRDKLENYKGSYKMGYFYYKDIQQALEHILSDYKRVLKENEELRQEKIDNQKINLLAQNSMLDYQNGYEDGKANRRSAVQSIIDNQQYYIFQKQIEKYEKEIEKLQKENEELKNLMAHKNDYTKKLEEDLFENCSNYVIPVQKVKDKIEEEKIPLTIVGGRKNKKTLEYGIKLGRRHVLQELLEGRK